MKKLFILISLTFATCSLYATIHTIQVWNGYFQFLPNQMSIQLGDTIQWVPLDPPTMTHTITSDSIPAGAEPFDQIWQLPADTFFQYVPQVAGLYKYVCTPHIAFNMIAEFTVTDSPSAIGDVDDPYQPKLIYPNPAVNVIHIKNLSDDVDYKIVDIHGKLMSQGITIGNEIDISNLSSGLYFVDIIGDKREILRFVKQ